MDQIDEFLTRGVANIIPSRQALEAQLRKGKKLNVYLGIDPTSTQIHLGHAVPLRKLQILSRLGHNVNFLIGDFTALIGDTSDKDSERPILTKEQIKNNFKTYKKQAQKFLDFSKVKVQHNSDWLKKLKFEDIIKLSRNFTLNDFISRELIKKRLSEGRSVSLPEVLYPVMQGYDSYFLKTDLQIGGTDQTFNMQAGRALIKNLEGKESFVLSTQFLTGTDGRKMSKSWGNAIWITSNPNQIYGQVMSLKDTLILQYFTLATSIPLSQIDSARSRLTEGENPINLKKELAFQIVSELFNSTQATTSQKYFEVSIQKGEIPKKIPTVNVSSTDLVEAMLEAGLGESKSSIRRVLLQGGIEINQNKVVGPNKSILDGDIIRVGKTKFARFHLN